MNGKKKRKRNMIFISFGKYIASHNALEATVSITEYYYFCQIYVVKRYLSY
jgi:hypothetical protein